MSGTRETDPQGSPITTIVVGRPVCTMINILTVKPEKQQELMNYLREMTEEVVVTAPGFISANFHLSEDGTKIINYAQWRSVEDLQEMLARNPHHVQRCQELSERIDIKTDLRVVYSVHASEASVKQGA